MPGRDSAVRSGQTVEGVPVSGVVKYDGHSPISCGRMEMSLMAPYLAGNYVINTSELHWSALAFKTYQV